MLARLKAAVAGEVERVRRAATRIVVFGGAAAFFAVAALIFVLSAGYMAMVPRVGSVAAALLMAGILGVLALAMMLGLKPGREHVETAAVEAEAARLEAKAYGVADAAGTVSGIVGAIAKELDGPSREAFLAGAKVAPRMTPVQLIMIAAAAGFFYARRGRGE